jgi:ABC-type polysaccharide/polyol phosphate export permease
MSDQTMPKTGSQSLWGALVLALSQLWKRGEQILVVTRYELVRSVSGQHMSFVWWFAEPLINSLIFYFVIVIVFHRGGPDYHFTLITGLLAWQLFGNTLNNVTAALTGNSRFLLRGIFPPVVAVIAPVLSGLFLATCAFSVAIFFIPYEIQPTLLLLPVVLFAQVLIGLAIGLPLAILNVALPDTRRLVHFMTRFGWFLSPVLYPITRITEAPHISEWVKAVYMLNPMVHTLSLMRYAFTGEQQIPVTGFIIYVVVAIFAVLFGLALIVRYQNSYMKHL